MKSKNTIYALYLLVFAAAIAVSGCKNQAKKDTYAHDSLLQLISYNDIYEVYVEAEPFGAGSRSDIMAFITRIEDFKQLNNGKVTATIEVDGQTFSQTIDKPQKAGVFKFTIAPQRSGDAKLKFVVEEQGQRTEIVMPQIKIYEDRHDAEHAAEDAETAIINTVDFSREQQRKIKFATGFPSYGNFGQVIKTAARLQSATKDEVIVVAKTSGTIVFASDNIATGKDVAAGQKLFSIATGGFSDNNLDVKYSEAKNNYNKAKLDYDRALELSKSKIISDKDFQQTKNDYENAKAIYQNLQSNFSYGGQQVTSSISGFIKQLNVQSGQFVEAGQALATIAKNKNLFLSANISPKYISNLANIQSAIVRTTDGKTYSLEELNGRLISYGKAAEGDNFLIPVTFQVENRANFIPGGLVDLFIKTTDSHKVISIPNEALIEEMGNYFVYVLLAPEKFEKRPVTIACTDGRSMEITGGLSKNERIVTSGAIMLKLTAAIGSVDAHEGHNH